MWPKQLLRMYDDDEDEKLREEMLKKREEDNALFEMQMEQGSKSMPEVLQKTLPEVLPDSMNNLSVWPENENGEVRKDKGPWAPPFDG